MTNILVKRKIIKIFWKNKQWQQWIIDNEGNDTDKSDISRFRIWKHLQFID